jgi:hypothetical protein
MGRECKANGNFFVGKTEYKRPVANPGGYGMIILK